jgi:membrane-bound serine protease (ClpP class)
MFTATPVYRSVLVLAVVVCSATATPGLAQAEDGPAPGLTVQFPAVITEDATARLRAAIYVPLRRYQAACKRDGKTPDGFELLCDFNPPPDARPDATDKYGPCWELASYLLELRHKNVKTRAYVHGEVSRHAVLPVIACGEIVMSSDARLGKVVEPGGSLLDSEKAAYEEMNGGRFPPALIRKMYDRDLVVVKLFLPDKDGNRYVDERKAQREKLKGVPVDGLGAGDIAYYDFAQARELGLCQRDEPQNTLADALAAFKLPRSSVYPLLDHTTAFLVTARGEVNGQLKEDVERRLDRALGDKANVIILRLECAGGDDRIAYDLARFIAGLKERADRPVKTVAYVTPEARDNALFLALACDQIVMQKDAHLGDFENYLRAHPDRLEEMRKHLKEAAETGFYPVPLVEDMLKPDPRTGKYPRLGAEEAKSDDLAQAVVNNYGELCTLENVKPAELDADWLNWLADFLCNPLTSGVLIVIGVTCLILELKMPGASLPGVIAAVCFVLFFWSQSQAHPEITWLAVLLFILGLLLIGVEVFVLPGTGVCGLSGFLLALTGLALVAFGHWPRTSEDWMGFGQKLGPFGVGILVSVGLAFLMVRYLKHIPFLNRLMLRPQTEPGDDGELFAPEPIRPELASLLGAIGVAATPLRPAGKTQFGDQYVDVMAEGGYVRPGARVQVIEIEGNRVVVKEV